MTATPATEAETKEGVSRGWLIALVLLIAGFTSIALDTAYHFNDSPLDGPFQLYNSVRRLAAGQRYGGTFQVFHGPGVPYLHLLPFLVFGGGFFASEFTRQVVSVGAAMAILLAFFRAWLGSWRAAIPVAVIALVALIPLRVNALLFPINSMIGLRSTMPLVVGIHLLLRPTGWRPALERGALMAIALACGVEQGMAATASLVIVGGVTTLLQRGVKPIGEALLSALSAILFYVAIVALMSPDGFRSVLQYNFSRIPADQFWYFGGPPNSFISRPLELLRFAERPLWLLMFVWVAVHVLRRMFQRPDAPDRPRRIAETFLIVYAAISTVSVLGTSTTVYLQPATRVALFIALAALARWWETKRNALQVRPTIRAHGPLLLVLLLGLVSIAALPFASIAVARTPLHMIVAHVVDRDPPALSNDWRTTARVGEEIFDRTQLQLGHRPVVWSTYSSLLEAHKGVFHPSYDYIIHALGPGARAQYASAFLAAKPDIVQTLDPQYTAYEEWLTVHHWNFYRPLLRDYHVTSVGPWSFFWTRDSVPFNERPQLVGEGAVPPGQLGIAIDGRMVPRDSVGLFDIHLYYHTRNSLRKLPVLGGLPRYLVIIDGAANRIPVSLAPYETEKDFPVVTAGPADIRMLGVVRSLVPGASLVFDSIRASRIRLSPANMAWAIAFIRGPAPDSSAQR